MIALFLLSGMFLARVNGQDKTQYLLPEIPWSINLNPAISNPCRTFIGPPILSDLGFFFRNNGFSWNEAFSENNEASGNSLRLNADRLSKVIGNRNHIRTGTDIGLFGFGFQHKDWYFSVMATNRSAARLTFRRDLIDARDGNWDPAANKPRQLNLNGTGIYFIDYNELAFGASHEVYDGLRVGGRVKFLLGAGNIQTRRSQLGLNTTVNSDRALRQFGYPDPRVDAGTGHPE